jgi:hypothetical protein
MLFANIGKKLERRDENVKKKVTHTVVLDIAKDCADKTMTDQQVERWVQLTIPKNTIPLLQELLAATRASRIVWRTATPLRSDENFYVKVGDLVVVLETGDAIAMCICEPGLDGQHQIPIYDWGLAHQNRPAQRDAFCTTERTGR